MAAEINAWTYGSEGYPSALRVSKIKVDQSPLRPTEIVVRVKAAALNPVDIQLMNHPLLPRVPEFFVPVKGVGEDFAGIVEQAGPDSGFKPGDEVFGVIFPFPNGTLQETLRIDTAKTNNAVVLKPHDWSWEQAAALPLAWSTSRTTIASVEPWVGDEGKVAILGGSSAAGMYAVHLAKKRGWTVIASCSSGKADFVKSMGADNTIDYRTESVPARLDALAPDAIIDCVGGTDCIGLAKRFVTIVGDKTSRQSLGGSATYLIFPQMILRSLRGLFGLGPSYLCVDYVIKTPWLEEALLLPKESIAIDSTFNFDSVKKAYERLNTGQTTGKVVITFT